MTPLGKPLVFSLKYIAEMDSLYGDSEEGKEPDLTGLDDAQNVREMARVVYFYCASLAWSAAAAWANVSFGGPKEHAHVYSPGTAGGSRPSPADRCLS